jgi:hypothetical protein
MVISLHQTFGEDHLAARFSQIASPVYEAAIRCLGWEMYGHAR